MHRQSHIDIPTALAHMPIFKGLNRNELARIVKGTREVQVDRGAYLFHKGDPCDGFHFILRGSIKLAFASSQGNEKVVEILGSGQTFGEALMFMDSPYIVFAQALSDCLLLHISKEVVFRELERDPALARKMLGGMSMRLHQLMSDVESYSLHSGTQRIIGYLLRELPQEEVKGDKVVTLPTSKGVIASRLNLTQEHFSRILHNLFEQGLIAVQGRRIRIPDINRLRMQLN